MTLSEGPRGLAVEATEHGGYVVFTPMGRSDPLGMTGPLFAGALDDCLQFIEDTIAKHITPMEKGKS